MGDTQNLQNEECKNTENQKSEENEQNKDPYNTANGEIEPLREDHETEGCEEKGTLKCIKEKGINVLDMIIRYNFNNAIIYV